MTVKETQELVKVWEQKKNIHYNQLTNMAMLTESVGELARITARRYGEYIHDPNLNNELSKNIGDIVWRALSIANQSDINVSEAMIDALERKNSER